MARIRWTGEGTNNEEARERAFIIDRDGVSIPGLLWTPDSGSVPQPLILMGHGAGEHKRAPLMLELGNMFARDYGWCAAAIDAPQHGGRGPRSSSSDKPPDESEEVFDLRQEESIVEEAIADWRTTVDILEQLGEVDAGRIGYWGMSTGTMFGIPYVSSDDRITTAVLGKAGMTGPIPEQTGIARYFEQYAPLIEIPVLFSMQWDDELFDRDGQFALFDLIGSEEKRLHAYPGAHGDFSDEVLEIHAEYFERQL